VPNKPHIEVLGKLEQKVKLRKYDVQNHMALNKNSLFLNGSIVRNITVLKES